MSRRDDRAELARLDATTARGLIGEGRLGAVELVEACLTRIEAREAAVAAWAFLDPAYARRQAERRDEERRSGRPLGPLHGIPVGIKDIIDTADMPTEHGTVLHAGRRPRRDAEIVRRLRAAGAVLLGKTVTTELAVYTPGKTRNPHDPSRTPGGSSSGSAAAVADQMVPLALGSQTNGSVIRPAAYCGVYGFKPSFGLLPRSGVLRQSPPLDHVGLFARSLDDLALLGDVLAGHDPGDPDSLLQAAPGLAATLAGRWPLTPELAFLRGPAWDEADAALRDGFTELVEALGGRAAAIPLPDGFDQAIALHRTIMESDLALSFAAEWQRGRDQLSERLRSMIASGLEHRASDYLRARAIAPRLRAALDPLFDRFDAILTPATTGAAPKTLEHTGSPICCTVWTYLGLPALSLPLLADEDGMPIGVQLVGRHGEDARLLRTARWLVAELGAAGAMREP